MSALAFPPEEHPVLDLLTVCDQLDEWSALLEERARQGAAPTVAYSADRRTAAVTLAARFSGTPVELRALDRLRLDRGTFWWWSRPTVTALPWRCVGWSDPAPGSGR